MMRLPKSLVYAGLVVAYVIGKFLIWNDRRVEKSSKPIEKPLGGEKLA